MSKLTPRNLTARRVAVKQFLHRSEGNPPSTLPDSAISNCFPGLEFDFRNVWRRIFVGIVMHEADNYVLAAEDAKHKALVGCRLLRVDGHDMTVVVRGPRVLKGPVVDLSTPSNPDAAWFMEWSNSLSRVLHKSGSKVECVFTAKPSVEQRRADYAKTQTVELEIRDFFEKGQPVISRDLIQPGDLTQSLCSPWQNDYRECACYYWASSRPDYVNVEAGNDGLSVGENWMQKRKPDTPPQDRKYLPDNREGPNFISYVDLFEHWETVLQFIVRGFDQGEK
jgi:hypothetical protein